MRLVVQLLKSLTNEMVYQKNCLLSNLRHVFMSQQNPDKNPNSYRYIDETKKGKIQRNKEK